MIKKVYLAATLAFLLSKSAFANSSDSAFKKKKLRKTDIEILYSHYLQDGNNSAVTGGRGTEKLSVVITSTGNLKLALISSLRRLPIISISFNHLPQEEMLEPMPTWQALKISPKILWPNWELVSLWNQITCHCPFLPASMVSLKTKCGPGSSNLNATSMI